VHIEAAFVGSTYYGILLQKIAGTIWSRKKFWIMLSPWSGNMAPIYGLRETQKDLLPDGVVCPTCGGTDFKKETDILDVWFDSGVSHAAVLEKRDNLESPCDMYLEGNDQHRGWFHSSLLESVGTRGRAPYKNVLTHGMVVDGEGKKMSKSLGNFVDPQKMIDQYGAEILRLWVAAEDYTCRHQNI